MTLFQKLRHWIFGTQYVLLIHHDGKYNLRPATKISEHWFSAPFLPDTRCKLYPGGKTKGQSYIHGWQPVTKEMHVLFDADSLG